MEWLQLLVLAVIQGLTEFLPISSSAHLILPAQLLGWQDQGLAFDVAVHIGTLLAVMLYYRQYLARMTLGALHGVQARQMNEHLRLGLLLIWATLPAVICGFLFKDMVEEQSRSVAVIASTTLLFGALLWLADAKGAQTHSMMKMGFAAVTLIGLAQALALIPGTSRSGITITAALLLGLRREDAANFSFLMSIPVILGAVVLMIGDVATEEHIYSLVQLLVACVVSALVAYLTIAFFIRLVNRLGMLPFVIYRLLLGAVLALFFL
ncbi:MAG: undecaprenyl-diphosphate phosphatase [Alcanivoracaceae bacterium]|jgi:undecaprenyl-diphosphatase|nr:undecaprenyl-diphosphate phosphatase [Alcanivoracaceae bacterium]